MFDFPAFVQEADAFFRAFAARLDSIGGGPRAAIREIVEETDGEGGL